MSVSAADTMPPAFGLALRDARAGDTVGPFQAEGGWAMTPGFGFTMSYTVVFERATADYDVGRGADALPPSLTPQGERPARLVDALASASAAPASSGDALPALADDDAGTLAAIVSSASAMR